MAILDGNHRIEIYKEQGVEEIEIVKYGKVLTEKEAIEKIIKINKQKAKFNDVELNIKCEEFGISIESLEDLVLKNLKIKSLLMKIILFVTSNLPNLFILT